MKKELIILLLAYVIATLIRGIILAYTGFSFSVWIDSFEVIPFLLDFIIWAFSYLGVRLIVNKISGNSA